MKSGFVALIGRPNVGKSTLLNRVVGEKVSIVSDKPQTTRRKILGILNLPQAQIIFVDTPGVHRPGFLLNERMMDAVYAAMREVDLILHMVDASESFGKGEQYVLDALRNAGKTTLLLLNKVDLVNKGKLLPVIDFYSRQGIYQEVIPLSALSGENLEALLKVIGSYLPEGPALYPLDYITDQQERAMVAEMIREKVLLHTRDELPYTTAVLIDEFDESRREEGLVRIMASVIVEKDGQKKIVIGRAGQMVKTVGTEARKEIKAFLGVKKLYLELNVRVVPNWRNQEQLLDDLDVR